MISVPDYVVNNNGTCEEGKRVNTNKIQIIHFCGINLINKFCFILLALTFNLGF